MEQDSVRTRRPQLSFELIEAVLTNNVTQLQCLYESGHSLNLRDAQGNTLLHLAIMGPTWCPTMDTFDYLLSLNKIPKDAVNLMHRTPLFEAFIRTSQTFALKLIKSGCDINRPFRDGNTPLHLAIRNDWIEVAELLIENGAKIDVLNAQGKTPLNLACCYELVDVIWMLLFYGADPNLANCFDICALRCVGPQIRSIFLDDLIRTSNGVNLSTFVYLMDRGDEENFIKLFNNLMHIVFDNSLRVLFPRKMANYNTKLLRWFLAKFDLPLNGEIIKPFLDTLFALQKKTVFQRYVDNLYILFQSRIGKYLIEWLNYNACNKQNCLVYFLEGCSRVENGLEIASKFLYFLFGRDLYCFSCYVDTVFYFFGYCKLFKMMIHLDILPSRHDDLILPQVIYNIKLTKTFLIRNILKRNYSKKKFYDIFRYFSFSPFVKRFIIKYYFENKAQPAVKNIILKSPTVPSLLELSRNKVRKLIIVYFRVKNYRQFHRVLHSLPILQIHKQILNYETQLYFFD